MMRPILTPTRLAEITDRFPQCRIAVVGDFFLDKYLDINPSLAEMSVETEKVAHQVSGVRCYPGAAGTVVSNLAALDVGQVHAIGMTGEDGEAYELRRGLQRLNCSVEHLHATPERFTPTYLKPRDQTKPGLDGEHSRYDTKNRQTLPAEIEAAVIGSLEELVAEVDAIVILDQVDAPDCGVITAAVREKLGELALANPAVLFWADSRCRAHEFRNVTMKPNQFEVAGIDFPKPGETVPDAKVHHAARAMRNEVKAPLFVTRGDRGMLVSDPEWMAIPGVKLDGEIDSTGAGDSATAGCVLSLCSGASPVEAAIIGVLVSSLTVQQLATTGTATRAELGNRLALWS